MLKLSTIIHTGILVTSFSLSQSLLAKGPVKSAPKQEEKKEAESNASCSVEIDGTDTMQYVKHGTKDRLTKLDIPSSCKKYSITLNGATLTRNAMGHNLIITRPDDMSKVLSQSIANTNKDNVDLHTPKVDGKLVLAGSTKLLGGGKDEPKTEIITIEPQKLGKGPYKGFCTFPGHSALMVIDITIS